jgi:Lysozyme like domain
MTRTAVAVARLGPKKIATLWVEEGGKKEKVAEAVATVLCESGGNTKAVSPVGARGLWQFMPGTLSSDKCAYDARCSTREAVKLSNGGEDFSPWDCHPDSIGRSGYGTGDATYEKYLGKYRKIDFHLGAPFGPGLDVPFPGPDVNPLFPSEGLFKGGAGDLLKKGVEGGADLVGLKPIAAFFIGLGELILTPEGWLRLGKMIGGGIMFLWGLRIFIRMSTGNDVVKTGKSAVSKAVEVAALAATVK